MKRVQLPFLPLHLCEFIGQQFQQLTLCSVRRLEFTFAGYQVLPTQAKLGLALFSLPADLHQLSSLYLGYHSGWRTTQVIVVVVAATAANL